MITQRFHVPEMSCHHCVHSITKEVSALVGVQAVNVVLDEKSVTVEHTEDVTTDTIIAAINEAGFDDVTMVS